MKYDLLVIGGGPAGLTAAIYARVRNKTALVLSNQPTASPLCKAEIIDNYPGLPHVSGLVLVEHLLGQARELGAEFMTGRVTNLMPMGAGVMAAVGTDVAEGTSAILCTGVARATPLTGEERLLGRGVSYCATCDGMLYRGKSVAVAGDAPDWEAEAAWLESIGCQVTKVRLAGLQILGKDRVTGVRTAAGIQVPCEGVFLLRASVAPAQMVPGLELEGSYIKTDPHMATNLPGIYAAGDCTGLPLQLAKAVGQGQMAAHWALNRE